MDAATQGSTHPPVGPSSTRAARAVAVSMMMLSLVGCTGKDTPEPTRSPSSTAPVVPSAPFDRSAVLTCEDSTSGTAPGPGSIEVGSSRIESLATPGSALPPLAQVGLRAPEGLMGWHFLKAPVHVPASSSAMSLESTDPAEVLFAWVPSTVWTSGAPDLSGRVARQITFAPCSDRDATYLGGMLVKDDRMCTDLLAHHEREGSPVTERLEGVTTGCCG